MGAREPGAHGHPEGDKNQECLASRPPDTQIMYSCLATRPYDFCHGCVGVVTA